MSGPQVEDHSDRGSVMARFCRLLGGTVAKNRSVAGACII